MDYTNRAARGQIAIWREIWAAGHKCHFVDGLLDRVVFWKATFAMKFPLRDLFWLMIVVGLATGWLITALAKAPTTSRVTGHVWAQGADFEGRIYFRSNEGLVVSALVKKGEFDLVSCPHGTYEVIFDGKEADLQYLNGGTVVEVSGYAMTIGFGHEGPLPLPFPRHERRDKDWYGL